MATQKAEWDSEYMTDKEPETIFHVKDGEHFFEQLKDRVAPKGIYLTGDYGSISFRDGKAEVLVIRGDNELIMYVVGEETVAIKERFRDFFREATGCVLIFESLTESEKEARREQREREQQKREQEQQERQRQRKKEEQKNRL